jgi:hypothetical protein
MKIKKGTAAGVRGARLNSKYLFFDLKFFPGQGSSDEP